MTNNNKTLSKLKDRQQMFKKYAIHITDRGFLQIIKKKINISI